MTPHNTHSARTARAVQLAMLAGISLMAALIIEATSARAELAKMDHGALDVESAHGQGSCFTVSLPTA